jgi:penicillin-binding protein 1C
VATGDVCLSIFGFEMKLRITRHHIRRSLKILGLGFLSLVLLFFILNWIFPLPSRIEYSTIITDNKGEVMHAFLTSDQKWRMKTELKEISPLLQKTIVAKEDRHFYSHPGVNPLAVVRAFFNNIFQKGRTSGASTITMQVAKALEPAKGISGASCGKPSVLFSSK